MKIISLNVGRPRLVLQGDRQVSTGIFKSPVAGPVMLHTLNFDGDRQADLNAHGGVNKALYAYPSEHYPFWRQELGGMELTWGNFGENLTTEGLLETQACIGDQYRIGGAVVRVSQPRIPCYKLGIRIGREDMPKRFLASGRSGIYFAVAEEGFVEAGDAIELVKRDEHAISVADVNRAYVHSRESSDLLRRIIDAEILPPWLQKDLEKRLATVEA
ncbi:MAG: MOSC domain-containing protein [Acidobacteriota bacterium]|nr:MOSC domain-containing protein [Acidobacteriota bacterium]MDE3170243.1 MOSC domain-containing protein [Acidobacteriota bacterium]